MNAINPLLNRHLGSQGRCLWFRTRYHGGRTGTLGNTGCFSFHPRKAITTTEGGMVTTQDGQLAEKIRRLRDHGPAISDTTSLGARPYLLADHPDAGYNQRMTDFRRR